MLRPYDLLNNILIDIEKGIRKGVNSSILARKYSLSEGHIRRLFRFAFKQPIAGYIRSRMLAASLDELLKTDMNILDIALNYGYRYEQTYIRAFKDEFGILPGKLRKTKQIIKIKPPLHLISENKLDEGILFTPEIVMVPGFLIAGNSNIIPFKNSVTLAPKAAIKFWENDRKLINNIRNPNIYIGFTCNVNIEAENSEYISSVQVENFNDIPEGLRTYSFEGCLCARFRYIGQHHYYDLSSKRAHEMYEKIWMFGNDKNAKYAFYNGNL